MASREWYARHRFGTEEVERMKYTPDRSLSDSERLVVIETLLVNALAQQEIHEQKLLSTDDKYYGIKRVLWVIGGAAAASLTTSGGAWFTLLTGGKA